MNKCKNNLNNTKKEYQIQSYVGDSECYCNAALPKNVLRCRSNDKVVILCIKTINVLSATFDLPSVIFIKQLEKLDAALCNTTQS